MNTTSSGFAYHQMVATRKYLEQYDLPEVIVDYCVATVRNLHNKRAELAHQIQHVQSTCERELANLNKGYRPNNLGIYASSVSNANRLASEIGMVSDELVRVISMINEIVESSDFSRDDLMGITFGSGLGA